MVPVLGGLVFVRRAVLMLVRPMLHDGLVPNAQQRVRDLSAGTNVEVASVVRPRTRIAQRGVLADLPGLLHRVTAVCRRDGGAEQSSGPKDESEDGAPELHQQSSEQFAAVSGPSQTSSPQQGCPASASSQLSTSPPGPTSASPATSPWKHPMNMFSPGLAT